MSLKIRKDDIVEVIAGREARKKERLGKRGRVLEVYPDSGMVLVEGVNVRKRHLRQRKNKAGQIEGGIIEKEAPIAICKVALVDPQTDRPTRVGFAKNEKGEKVRVARTKGKGTVLG